MRNEVNRLRDLSSFALNLDGLKEELQPFVELSQFIAQTATCEINVIDAYNQWTLSRTEDTLKVLAKEESICYHTIMKDEPYEVPNLQKDDRYQERPYVKGNPWYKYYYGVQLKSSDGLNIGSLCVLDPGTKKLTDKQKTQLKNIASLIVDKLEGGRDFKGMVQKLDNYKDKFHSFTHDLRSPVNGIVGVSEMLTEEDVDKDTRQKLSMIRDCAITISDEMDAVLNAVDEQDRNALKRMSALGELPDKVARLYQPQAESKDIDLQFHADFDGDIELPAYYLSKIAQIVGNLVANALKFTYSGGLVEVSISTDDARRLNVEVKDDGEGMSPDQVKSFNKEQEVAGTEGTAGEPSYGIGLQLVRDLVREESGTIEVESTEGKGTYFSVMLPL